MAKKNHRVEILVAIIGSAAILGAAVIANWDKLFAPKSGPAPEPTVQGPISSPTNVVSSPTSSPNRPRESPTETVTTTPTPIVPSPTREEASPVTAQEVWGIRLDIVGTRRIGDTLYLNLRLTNDASEAKLITLFGKGLYAEAKIYADGNIYEGSYVSAGSEELGLVDVRVPGQTYVNANIVFKGLPTNLHFATTIEIPYSSQNNLPAGRMHFTKISIN
ncbi:MAG TPA: hypothetical protein VGN90_17720 [Pyrinomonadaceae bacterium]|jgi:hypothetical protein|nr:hypothetical protein [Pyrinomonadaceae bacterium]